MEIPKLGQLIRYSYLWHRQAEAGQEEGLKDRPCAVVIATRSGEGEPVLYLAPVTHSRPAASALGVEIPRQTRQRLKLDDERCWIVTTEVNKFTWPGPDLRPDEKGEVVIGYLPGKILRKVIDNLRAHATANTFRSVPRDD